jgi:hypothetical protein
MKAERPLLSVDKATQSTLFLTSLQIAVVGAGLWILVDPELCDYAKREFYSSLSVIGFKHTNEFTKVYQKLRRSPLPAGLAASTKISSICRFSHVV